MKTTKAYQFRIYPNSSQRAQIDININCARFAYNRGLDIRSSSWKNEKRSVNAAETMRLIADLKNNDDYSWLKEADSMCLQEALKDLDAGFKSFFEHRAKYPRFHKKRNTHQSYRTRNQSNGIRITDNHHIRLPKLGNVKIKLSREISGRILNVTVKHTPTDKYFVSVCFECDQEVLTNNGSSIGIDVGLKEFCTLSDGTVIDNPSFLKQKQKKLLKEQRRLSRMIQMNIESYAKGHRPVYKRPLSECKNIQKQIRKVAEVHESVSNARRDFLHKQSSIIAGENQAVCVEDLNMRGMMKNRKLAKSVSDVSWSEFIRMLEYKTKEHGGKVVKVPRFYASSQTCSVCGSINPSVKDLKIRRWTCPVCNAIHDRDLNAAKNILNKGLEVLSS